MRVCITSAGPNLDSLVDLRFGRCLYFIFVNGNNLQEIEVISNKGKVTDRGAGIQAAQTVVNHKAEAVITGNVGPNSLSALNSSGIKIFQASPGTKVKETLPLLRENKLLEIVRPVGPGFGAPNRGRGRGRGGFGPAGGRRSIF